VDAARGYKAPTMTTPRSGWITFAGVMLVLVGSFDIIDGIAALSDSNYLVNQLLFANLHAWGIFFVIWGAVQILAGLAVMRGAVWAAFVGGSAAFINILAQISWAHANPVWALAAVTVDVLIIYALCVYGGQGDGARR
jgi:hypothetical protein